MFIVVIDVWDCGPDMRGKWQVSVSCNLDKPQRVLGNICDTNWLRSIYRTPEGKRRWRSVSFVISFEMFSMFVAVERLFCGTNLRLNILILGREKEGIYLCTSRQHHKEGQLVGNLYVLQQAQYQIEIDNSRSWKAVFFLFAGRRWGLWRLWGDWCFLKGVTSQSSRQTTILA